ncbi:hypothetical protein GCM10008931_41990 [Oceanobacillus oncorhynchi subsp. oncorhynchi]
MGIRIPILTAPFRGRQIFVQFTAYAKTNASVVVIIAVRPETLKLFPIAWIKVSLDKDAI